MKKFIVLLVMFIAVNVNAGCPTDEQLIEVAKSKYYIETLEITPFINSKTIYQSIARIVFNAVDLQQTPAVLLIINGSAGDYWSEVILSTGIVEVFVEDKRIEGVE